jgi:hypothetical protein
MYDIHKPESLRAYLKELYTEKEKLDKEHEFLIVDIKSNNEEIEKVEILLDDVLDDDTEAEGN